MTTADYALIVSILSLMISLGGLAWNVWSKFIFPKARVRVSFQVMTAYGVDARPQLTRMSLSATNFGPGQVRMHMAVVRVSKGWFRKLQDGFINPLPSWDAEPTIGTGPFVGGMRNAIEEGRISLSTSRTARSVFSAKSRSTSASWTPLVAVTGPLESRSQRSGSNSKKPSRTPSPRAS